MQHQIVVEDTRRWLASIVIGLNLCPFARKVFDDEKIRYIVTDASTPAALLAVLGDELATLAAAPRERIETTLLIHPGTLPDFLDYNDFLGEGEDLIDAMGLRAEIQLASFHPDYQFAGVSPDAVEHYTNRSPYPMLHLLREAAVEEVADDPEMLANIPHRNIDTLNKLGRERLLKLFSRTEPTP